MRKIIDLIEKYFELDDNAPAKEAVEERDKWADTIWHIEQEIGDRVARRRELEATPITEDWLKEHGFIDEPQERTLIYRKGIFCIECDLTTWEWYWANGDVILHSLADLYDACELCGINLEDCPCTVSMTECFFVGRKDGKNIEFHLAEG